MVRRTAIFVICASASLAPLVSGLSPVVEAAKPPKLQEYTAMTTFRCTAGEPASPFCETVSDTTDRIRDDGSAYGYSPIVAKIWSSGFYSFHFEPPSGRLLNLDLGDPIGTVPCLGVGLQSGTLVGRQQSSAHARHHQYRTQATHDNRVRASRVDGA